MIYARTRGAKKWRRDVERSGQQRGRKDSGVSGPAHHEMAGIAP